MHGMTYESVFFSCVKVRDFDETAFGAVASSPETPQADQ